MVCMSNRLTNILGGIGSAVVFVLLNFLFLRLQYSYNISPFPLLTPNCPIYPSCSPSNPWPLLHTVIAGVFVYTHIHIPKYSLSSSYNIAHMYVFRAALLSCLQLLAFVLWPSSVKGLVLSKVLKPFPQTGESPAFLNDSGQPTAWGWFIAFNLDSFKKGWRRGWGGRERRGGGGGGIGSYCFRRNMNLC